jgi:aminoglycoside phosphotransferase (APT) family kinase protein
MYQGRRRSPKPQPHRAESERQHHHTPWATIDDALHTLYGPGIPVASIARQLGISRPTVYAYLRRTTPPSPKRPQFQWTARVDALPVGWVHDDYHGRNMVFVQDEMRGLFDFDAVERGPLVIDVAYGTYSFGREARGSMRGDRGLSRELRQRPHARPLL